MKILLSEAAPDYAGYVFPYAVWGFLEPGESPATAFAAGFLPSLPDLSRFYLCRQVRVVLPQFSPSSENRRVLRHGSSLTVSLLEREDFEWTPARRQFCLDYAAKRWSSPPSPERIEGLFHVPLTTHVVLFQEADGTDAGIVSLYRDGTTWFYSNAFYPADAPSGRGAFLMTETVRRLSAMGQDFLHLGTCYARSALYKAQFPGVEFFDGTGWSGDLKRLKQILSRQEGSPSGHLLEDDDYRARWIPQGLAELVARSPLRLETASETSRPPSVPERR
jgi:hypothetical protein